MLERVWPCDEHLLVPGDAWLSGFGGQVFPASVLPRLEGGFARLDFSLTVFRELITVSKRVFLEFRSVRSKLLCGRLPFVAGWFAPFGAVADGSSWC